MKIINDFNPNLTLYGFENEKNGERMEDHFILIRGAYMVDTVEFSLQ